MGGVCFYGGHIRAVCTLLGKMGRLVSKAGRRLEQWLVSLFVSISGLSCMRWFGSAGNMHMQWLRRSLHDYGAGCHPGRKVSTVEMNLNSIQSAQ